MAYFDLELKSTLIFAVVGIIIGYISFTLNHTAAALGLAIVVYIILHLVVKKVFDVKEEKKWWTSHAAVFFLLWFVIWTILYNFAIL